MRDGPEDCVFVLPVIRMVNRFMLSVLINWRETIIIAEPSDLQNL